MAFFECEFPREVAFLAQGGPTFSTQVNEGFSGFEQRNKNWKRSRGKWTISLDHKPQSYFDLVDAFFRNVAGKGDAFRLFDAKDNQAVNQPCALVLNSPMTNTVYQLQTTYTAGSRTYTKLIFKPITAAVQKYDGTYCADTVTIKVAGSVVSSGWTLDETTGLLTFESEPSETPTATFQYHYPVRFDTDECQAVLEESDVAGGNALITWSGVQLIEERITPAGVLAS